MDSQTRLEQAKKRFSDTVKHQKTDRPPILLSSGIAMAKYHDPSIVIADAVERPFWVADQAILGLEELKYVDGMGLICQAPNNAQSSFWMAKMKLPGVDLGRDELWQIDEVALMTVEDYDTILNDGWKPFFDDYMARLGATPDEFELGGKAAQYGDKILKEHGYINCPDMLFSSTYDCLSSGRGMLNFAKDMRKIPEKVKAVLDVMLEDSLAQFKAMADETPPELVFVQPGVRSNADFLSHDKFEEFVFPHFRAMTNLALEYGATVYFHCDANWTGHLDLFTEFPKHRCIFDTDGMTDIYKLKEILGDRMAITGNISPSLLSVGAPDDVYTECRKLIDDMGDGFIMAPACGLPPNAKRENIDAMIAATVD